MIGVTHEQSPVRGELALLDGSLRLLRLGWRHPKRGDLPHVRPCPGSLSVPSDLVMGQTKLSKVDFWP
jgi:hypothetical protein